MRIPEKPSPGTKEAHIPENHHIHLVTDRKRASLSLRDACFAAIRGGVDIVQLREKGGPALTTYEDALALLPETRKRGASIFLNDRVDVALAASADGVHLAGKSLPPEVARELLPSHMTIGVSVHSADEARIAVAGGADYVTFGHVYPTSSKPGLAPRGIRQLAEIVTAVEVPVVAIGGIEAANVAEVLSTGAAGVAVISSIIAADDPEDAAKRLREAVNSSPHEAKHYFDTSTLKTRPRGEAHAFDREP